MLYVKLHNKYTTLHKIGLNKQQIHCFYVQVQGTNTAAKLFTQSRNPRTVNIWGRMNK